MAALIVVPVAIIVKLVILPFERPVERSAQEVADYLRDFLNDTSGDWDFDDFTSIPIADPRLDSIRERASALTDPLTDQSIEELKALLAEAEALAESTAR